jgi:replication-associated recombination protein RarA
MSYDIGYRRPPPSGQFKKGASGNPKGRPKGSKNFVTLLEKELAQKIVVNENGKKKSITRLQAMVKRMVAGALQGDQKSLLTLLEVLRRSGQMQPPETGDLLPDNYSAILDAYVETRSRGGKRSNGSEGER